MCYTNPHFSYLLTSLLWVWVDQPAWAAKMSGVFPSLSARFGSTSSATVASSSRIGMNPLAHAWLNPVCRRPHTAHQSTSNVVKMLNVLEIIVCAQPRSHAEGWGARAPPSKVWAPPHWSLRYQCIHGILRRCQWHTTVPCKYAQNCMILRTKFQKFSLGNTPIDSQRGRGWQFNAAVSGAEPPSTSIFLATGMQGWRPCPWELHWQLFGITVKLKARQLLLKWS